jgi:hypothetical protein
MLVRVVAAIESPGAAQGTMSSRIKHGNEMESPWSDPARGHQPSQAKNHSCELVKNKK